MPLRIDRAVAVVDEWFEQQAVEMVLPTPRHWSTLHELLTAGQAGGALTTDAHIAALSIEHGATVYTTDRDFTRSPAFAR